MTWGHEWKRLHEKGVDTGFYEIKLFLVLILYIKVNVRVSQPFSHFYTIMLQVMDLRVDWTPAKYLNSNAMEGE